MNTLLSIPVLLAPLVAGPEAPPAQADQNIVETAIAAGSFQTLAAALQAADLLDALQAEGPYTVFAPTDAAFAKLPEGTLETLLKPENQGLLQTILLHHVVDGAVAASEVVGMSSAISLAGQRLSIDVGEGVMVGGSQLTKTDIECSNGMVHVVDTVILPATEDIVATALAAGKFNTLTAALKAAGLVGTLKGEGPFTVFAPTDAAFEALPSGTVAALLKPENQAKLAAILSYHVVPGRIYAKDAVAAERATSLQGGALRFTIRAGRLMVNGAQLVASDVEASNGVIHVVDQVLLPR